MKFLSKNHLDTTSYLYVSSKLWKWHSWTSKLWTPYSLSFKIHSFIGVGTDIRDCGVLGSTLSVKLYTLQLCGAELELNRFWSRRRRRWFYYKRSHLTSWRSHSWFPFALIVCAEEHKVKEIYKVKQFFLSCKLFEKTSNSPPNLGR